MGNLRHLEEITWTRVVRLVFVCRGNICRSPYAQAKTKSLGYDAASFGLNADGYSACDPTAVRIALERGVDLTGCRSCHADTFSIKDGDLLIGMESWHAERLQTLTKESGSQVTLLGLWVQPPRPHIEDPYGLGDAYFHTCFLWIDAAVENILQKVMLHKNTRPQ
ncbi:MAG: phosphotyrosine protein phosphatase [Deltaproteobacteria bacterium]|nr:phosphotyrosine protein phosphatase [Deltaproteobacteria bacterium]